MAIEIITRQKTEIKKGERKLSRFFRIVFEDTFKVPVFGCKHCGECLLSSTAFTCSQRCPKRLRNGPCGGTGKGGRCEVYPDRACIWYLIHKRSKRLHRMSFLHPIKKMHNWNLEGSSAWLNVFKKRIEPPVLFNPKEPSDQSED